MLLLAEYTVFFLTYTVKAPLNVLLFAISEFLQMLFSEVFTAHRIYSGLFKAMFTCPQTTCTVVKN
jgi:hypothetical protein